MNDQPPIDLERARETVNALAQHVDTEAAWNEFTAAGEGARRAYGPRRAQQAAVLVAITVLIGTVAFTVSSRRTSSTVRVTASSPPTTTPTDCTLPSLPVPGADSSGNDLSGPAVVALRGGAARVPFHLDGGQFTMTPPHSGDAPTVSENQAECAALASISDDGRSLLDLAFQWGGAAVGYGRVNVAPHLLATAQKPSYLDGGVNQNTIPTMPKPTAYKDRLAWLVVVKDVMIFNGPPQSVASPTSSTPAPTRNGYAVFLIDAETGSDALLYTEGQPDTGGKRGTPPETAASVIVPAEQVSVPWTLTSRSLNGYTGEISATVLPCDGYPNPVYVERARPAVAVVVQRPVGASCGAAKQVALPLHAATVTSDLPTNIAHEPLGPYVTLPSGTPSGPPGATGRVLRQVGDQDNGRTIQITVGSVLAIAPLMDVNHDARSAVVSSDPTVLGLIDGASQSPVGEFRAWRTGHADLSVPTTACNYPKSNGLPCTGPWIVHVDIK